MEQPSIRIDPGGCGCGGHGPGKAACGCGGHAAGAGACGCGGHAGGRSARSLAWPGMMALRRAHAVAGLAIGVAVLAHLALAATAWVPAWHDGVVAGLAPWRRAILAGAIAVLALQGATGLAVLAHTGLRGGCRAESRPRLALAQRLSAIVLAAFLVVHLLASLLRDAGAAPATVVAGTDGSVLGPLMLVLTMAGGLAAAVHIATGVHTAPTLFGAPATRAPAAIAVGVVLAVLACAGAWAMAYHD